MTNRFRNPLVMAALALSAVWLSMQGAGPALAGDPVRSAAPIDGSLSVHNNLCVGASCPDSASYGGSDTIRLQGEALGIFFNDTTITGSPTQDWRITANDPGPGGSNYFAIGRDDFPRQLLLRGDGGIELDQDSAKYLRVSASQTPTIRLEQNGETIPYVWDLAGDETGFAVSNVTGGGVTSFLVASGAGANALVIRPTGVGVGIDNPTAALDVGGGAFIRGDLEVISSRDYKRNIRPLEEGEARAALMELEPVHFRYNTDPDRPQLGFIAEDVPGLVASQDRKSLSPMDLVALLARAAQAQELLIEEQAGMMQEQAARIEALEARLASLRPAAEQ